MGIKVTLEGRKPPVYEITGDTLEEFQETLEYVGIDFDLLMAESEAVSRFRKAKQNSGEDVRSRAGGSNLRTAPDVPLSDGSRTDPLPIPDPDAEAPADTEGEEGNGEGGPTCAECGSVMDLTPKQSKRLYGRDDICSDCGDAMK